MLITPKNAIETVLKRKTSDSRFVPYENRLQKWLFFLALGSLGLGAVAAAVTFIWKSQSLVLIGVTCLAASTLLAMAYQVATAMPELAKLRNIEREISSPLLQEFDADIELINELAQLCDQHHLSYAKASYLRMSKHLRERISILVGAIDKVGVIPIAITGYLSYAKAQHDGLVSFGGIEWVLAAFVALYLLAIRMTSAAQWMESVAEIYDHAIAMRSKRERSPIA